MRVPILAPVGRDAGLLASTLGAIDVETAIAIDASALLEMLAEGAGAVLIADEALTADHMQALTIWLGSQPPWSDTPLVILTASGKPTLYNQQRARKLSTLGNVTLIERMSGRKRSRVRCGRPCARG